MSAALVSFLRHLRPSRVGEADVDLLRRFSAARDDEAFAELVRRHGPVVFRVCQRLVGTGAADDAFQATFLVFARRPGAALAAPSVGHWLVGVAARVGRQARRSASRRDRHEASSARRAAIPATRADDGENLSRVLSEEVSRLPDRLRVPAVLCLIDDLTQEQAGAVLGCAPRTVRRRLDEARRLLRSRLTRRGVVPTLAGGLGIGSGVASGAVPPGLTEAVARAVRGGRIPVGVRALVSQGLRTPPSAPWKPVLACALVAGGLLFAVQPGPGGPVADTPRSAAAVGRHSSPAVAPAPRPAPAKLVRWSAPAREPAVAPWWSQGEGAVFTPDGGHVLTTALTQTGPGDLRGGIRVRDAATGAERSTVRGSARRYDHLTLSPDGRMIVAVGGIPRLGKPLLRDQSTQDFDWVIEVWEWGTWRLRSTFAVDADGEPRRRCDLRGLAVSPDGRTVVALDAEATLSGWDLATGRRRFRPEPAQPIAEASHAALAFTPDSRHLTAVDGAGRVRRFDARTGELRWHAQASTTPCGGTVAFFPDRETVAAGQCLPDGGPRWTSVAATWRLPSQPGGTVTVKPLYVREVPVVGPGGAFSYPHLYRVACSPDGRWMAGVGSPGSLRLFESTTGREVAHGREQRGGVVRLVFSPDSRTLLLTGQNTLELWSVAELLKRKPE